MRNRIIAAVCAVMLTIPLCLHMLPVSADYSESDLRTAAMNAIKWKASNDSPLYNIGSNNANLYITALRRLGGSYDYAAYLEGLDGIAAGYGSAHNASDMQRTALAAAAAGGDARNIGGRDLIADSTYYRDAAAPLDKNGPDGLSWALIALDSEDYEVPDWAIKNRNQIIAELLAYQNTDGSFNGSVYSTASAITALARYIETSGSYTITQLETGQTIDLSPRNAVSAALTYLSETQTKDGDWEDLISTAMTVIALDSVGIDADKDTRFVGRNGSAIDGLMSYQNRDGGFAYDDNNSEGEATSYALCALASHLRIIQNKTALFYLRGNDTVTLEPTPVPAASSGSSEVSSSSSSNSRTSSGTSGSSSVRATTRPSTSASSSARATQKPVNTMRPTRTAAPGETPAPGSTIKLPTPKPTRRPDLVGPVMMPGPMKPTDPPEIINGGQESETRHRSPAGIIFAVIAALLVLGAIAALAFLKSSGMLPESIGKKKKKNKDYKAKQHRKTEQHERFNERERYRERLKYKGRKK